VIRDSLALGNHIRRLPLVLDSFIGFLVFLKRTVVDTYGLHIVPLDTCGIKTKTTFHDSVI
jgi:hypothetical protein